MRYAIPVLLGIFMTFCGLWWAFADGAYLPDHGVVSFLCTVFATALGIALVAATLVALVVAADGF